ncbi:hypothetical protein M0534_10710 [Methylonatrum kenyense]|uniref:hypothetical protein n=1 Tax=Methylonatrum kenyense TaxID=455253 RepID=UPI0020BD884F|nr:hypothetical protein [Methylonatrum kenyense]MCK8516787.1 hypothetical protein [Methylonatrum kenyense]
MINDIPRRSKTLLLQSAVILPLIASGVAHAAPEIATVDGTLAAGSTLTIEGTGFGSKSRPQPALWDTTDNQADVYSSVSNGAPIPTGQNYPFTSTNQDVYLERGTNDRSRYDGDSMRYVTRGNGALSNPTALGGNSPPTDIREIYVRYWSRFERTPLDSGSNASHKFMRVWTGSGDDLRISWTQKQLTVNNRNAGGTSAKTVWEDWTGDPNAWNLHEFWINADRGLIVASVNGDEYIRFQDSDSRYLARNHPTGLRIAQIGWNPSHGTSSIANQTQWISDIYIDTTPARVLISDQPRWSSVTHSEILIPSSWSDSEISVDFEPKSLSETPNEDLYLYVVNPDGVANSRGYALSCPSCPSAPGSLQAN